MYKSLDLFLKFMIVVFLGMILHENNKNDKIINDINFISNKVIEINQDVINNKNDIDSLIIENNKLRFSVDSIADKNKSMNNTLNKIRKSSIMLF